MDVLLLESESSQSSDCDSVSCFISSLPSEVLNEIFRLLINSHPRAKPPVEIVLSHVSRSWRDDLIMAPLFWTTIDIWPSQNPLILSQYISEYLFRSKECPITITFRYAGFPCMTIAAVAESMELLLPHLSRWQKLQLNVHDPSLIYYVCSHLRDAAAPCLDSVSLVLNHSQANFQEVWQNFDLYEPIFLGGCPNLKSLEVVGVNPRCCWITSSSVTHLILDGASLAVPIDYTRFSQLIASASSLTHLVLHDRVVFHPHTKLASPIESTSLLSLDVSLPLFPHSVLDGELYVSNLFQMTTPSLTSLCLRNFAAPHTRRFLDAIQQLSPKYPALQLLRLQDVLSATAGDFATRLDQAMPKMMRLDVERGRCLPALKSNAAGMFPCLRIINAASVPFNDVYEFMSSRIDAGTPITELRVEASVLSDLLPHQIKWLQDNVQIGTYIPIPDKICE